jgi:hypothetical protein
MLAPAAKSSVDADLADLAFTLVALLRGDGHLCNVLTHIASGDWRAIERAILSILTPRITPKKLSGVARNLLELLCDNRGVTGPLMRPFFFGAIERVAGRAEMRRLEAKVQRLRRRISADLPACRAPQGPDRPARRKRASQRLPVLRTHIPAEEAQTAHGGPL